MARCSVKGCDTDTYTRGWCRKHYVRWQRHGDPVFVKQIQGDDEARFMSKVRKLKSGCWEWTGYISPFGYGKFGSGGRHGPIMQAHRWAYEHWIGPIPNGLTIDHLCHNRTDCKGGTECLHRRCVNPEHLDTTTLADNTARSPNALQRRTHCVNGHEFTPENTASYGRGRACRQCHRDAALRRYHRRAERAKNRTHCVNGHPYAPDNLIITASGQRLCATCAKQRRKGH